MIAGSFGRYLAISARDHETVASGWANLGRAEVLSTGHRFPACRVTRLITATAVLRLVAGGKVGLNDPANDHLRTFRLADDSVTVRDLLTHTGGVDDRGGPLVADGGYAALGQLVADVTRSRYADAAARLVLEPLGMSDSSFPGRWPAGGMWTTAADLVRFGAMWSSLLPEALAREALRPQAARGPGGFHIGLGWFIGQHGDIAGISGGCPGAFASLLVRVPGQRGGSMAHVALTNRRLPILDVNARVLRLSSP